MGFDGGSEIFAEDGAQAGLDMTTQCVADIDLLAGNCQLHRWDNSFASALHGIDAPRYRNWEGTRERSSGICFTSRAAFPAGVGPRKGYASLHDISRLFDGRCRPRAAAAI